MLLFWGWAHPSVIQFRQGYVAHSPRVRKKGGILFLFTLSFSILALGLGAIKSPFDRLPAVLGSMFYGCLSVAEYSIIGPCERRGGVKLA